MTNEHWYAHQKRELEALQVEANKKKKMLIWLCILGLNILWFATSDSNKVTKTIMFVEVEAYSNSFGWSLTLLIINIIINFFKIRAFYKIHRVASEFASVDPELYAAKHEADYQANLVRRQKLMLEEKRKTQENNQNMSYGRDDVINIATKLGRLVNGGVVGY